MRRKRTNTLRIYLKYLCRPGVSGAESEQVRMFYISHLAALTLYNNLAFDNFSGVYQGSVKHPDHFLRVDTLSLELLLNQVGVHRSHTCEVAKIYG